MASLNSICKALKEAAVETIRNATIYLPLDVYEALRKAIEIEEEPIPRAQLKAIVENVELAAKLGKPICQDTGMPIFYVEVGSKFPGVNCVREALVEAVREATVKVPLRPNAVDPMLEKNTGDNTGRHVPIIDVEIVEGEKARVTYLAKGGGSEYPTLLKMIPPAQGLIGVKKAVIEAVFNAGPKPCPPVVVSVGISGSADVALKLAKKGFTRPIGDRHSNPEVARLEEELLRLVNEVEIGPHGFGGKTTALDVKVDYGARHPASYAVAVAFMCWAVRRGSFEVSPSGDWKITSKHFKG